MFIEGEGAPEQGPQPLRASGVFLDPLEPRLEPLEPRLEGRLEARYPLRAFRGFVPISDTPSLFFSYEGFVGHRPPDTTIESTSSSPPQGSIWHRFNIDSTLIRHRFLILPYFNAKLTPEEGSGGPAPNKPLTILDLARGDHPNS